MNINNGRGSVCTPSKQKPATMETYSEIYKRQKTKHRLIAITWKKICDERGGPPPSYIPEIRDYFHKQGKRYGLLKFFRENSIPC